MLRIAAGTSDASHMMLEHHFQAVRTRGFSLVEIMIVVAMMAILAAIAYPKFVNATDDARDSATRAQLRSLRTAIERYQGDLGVMPDMSDWDSLVDNAYITIEPVNPSNGFTTIAGAAGANVGWVWRARSGSDPTMQIYATGTTSTAEFSE